MTIFILFIAIIVIGVIQYYTLKNSLEKVEEDYRTSAVCVEPEEQLELILSFRNRSRMFLPYLRYQMTLPEGFKLVDPNARGSSSGRHTVWHTGGVAASTVWLGPRQKLERHIPITAPGRGRYPLHELTVYGGDFLGMKESVRGTYRYREPAERLRGETHVRCETLGGLGKRTERVLQELLYGEITAEQFIGYFVGDPVRHERLGQVAVAATATS